MFCKDEFKAADVQLSADVRRQEKKMDQLCHLVAKRRRNKSLQGANND